jgi:hypothetical protein
LLLTKDNILNFYWKSVHLSCLLAALACAAGAVPGARAQPETPLFAAKITIKSTDPLDKAGTVFEALGRDGKPVIGVGFPDVFNTVQHQADGRLSVFVRDGNETVEVTDLGKPPGWLTTRLMAAGDKIIAANSVNGEHFGLDEQKGRWNPLNKSGFTSAQARARGLNLASTKTDCGYLIAPKSDAALLGNCVIAGGKHISLLGGRRNKSRHRRAAASVLCGAGLAPRPLR